MSILNKFIGLLLLTAATFGYAGTYDGSYYNDQQRATMVQDYANQVYISGKVGSVESVLKYQDTRLLNGKKGYIGSVIITRRDDYLKTTGSVNLAPGEYFAKQSIVHLFDNSVVNKYIVADGGADCRSFTSPTRTVCWGSNGLKNAGLIGLIEIKTKNPYSSQSISTQFGQDINYLDKYYTYYKQTSGTSREPLYIANSSVFNDTTLEMGLIYNALQNSDGSFPTKEVLTPPMEITIIDPVPPAIVIDNSCKASSKLNNKQLDSNICLNLTVVSGCRLIQDVYAADFGIISAGNVAESVANINLICSTGQTFKIKPGFDHKDVTKTHETYQATMWVDTGKNVRLLSNGGINGVGTGQIQTLPIYMKITGKGKDFGRGNVIVEATQFTDTYPIELAY